MWKKRITGASPSGKGCGCPVQPDRWLLYRHFTGLGGFIRCDRDGSFTRFFAVITPFSSTEAMLERADLYVTGCPVDVSAFSRAVYPFSKDMDF